MNKQTQQKTTLAATLFLVFSQYAVGQQPPTGGGQLQQIPPPATPARRDPEIRLEPSTAPANPADEQTRILVNSLRVTDARIYTEAELIALTGVRPGTELTLGDLRAMAARITDHYRKNGYFVAQAYLPAQQIMDGAVTLRDIEGRYGQVTLRNNAKVRNSIPESLLAGINPGDPIEVAPLETRLMLLSDVPGVNARSTLVPGSSPGTSDLVVELTPGKSITGNGDVLSLRVLTSGQGLKYGRASYQMQLGRATVGVAYTAVDYRLGKEFENLRAHGTARTSATKARSWRGWEASHSPPEPA